jgi:alkylated DNA repair dioxygenase AlkB
VKLAGNTLMNTLFPLEPLYPPGFEYFPGFINTTEEDGLCREVQNTVLHAFSFQGFEAKRKVASFGYDYNFDKGGLTKGIGIPSAFQPLIQKVAAHLSIPGEQFAELLVTEYPAGSVINWHRDAPPFDIIVGISLASDCTFRLRPYDKAKQGKNSVLSFPVQRRSLYVIRGEARTEWQHSIAPVKQLRYSITLRTLRDPKDR